MPGYRKLGRTSAHRKAMLRNLVTDLFREGRITTTDTRAKEARRQAEKMITLAKRGDLHARRQVLAYVYDETVVAKLFDEIAPKYEDRPVSYTHLDVYKRQLFALFNLFSGGAFSNFTIFALSITPYITASIILQLLTIAVPSLERLAREGTEGRKKIAQYTRYLTVILAIIQAIGVSIGLFRKALISTDFFSVAVIVLVLTAGTAFLMWLGEQINEHGIGNGISLIIFAGIISRLPSASGRQFLRCV